MNEERPRVLVVDDVEANLVAIEAVLAPLDCTLVSARSGNEALRLLLKHEFALVILDVQMPEMDGFEVARLARNQPSTVHVPIMFVTALHETEESVFQGYETGAVDLLFKPVDPYILRSKVKVFLDLERSRRDLTREIEAHKATLDDLKAFNYSVAHDLRAPVRALDGFSRVLLEDHVGELSDEAKHNIELIVGAANRMRQLIDDLLRLSHIGRAALVPEPIDLSAIAGKIVEDLRGEEPSRNVDLEAPAALAARGDARLVRVMLENLVRNAWKFTSKKPRATIELGTRNVEGETIYFVRDDGVGFDEAYAGRLFWPFQRLHSTADFEGTGIGLTIVRRIVHHHSGRIWAESKVGLGATFSFTLPSPTPQRRERGVA